MMINSQYHIFELDTINIYSVCVYGARNNRPCFRENQPKRSFSIKWKRAFWACFRENCVYKFGHGYYWNVKHITQSDFDNAFSSAAIVLINKPIFDYLFVLIHYFFGRQSTLEPRPALWGKWSFDSKSNQIRKFLKGTVSRIRNLLFWKKFTLLAITKRSIYF